MNLHERIAAAEAEVRRLKTIAGENLERGETKADALLETLKGKSYTVIVVAGVILLATIGGLTVLVALARALG